MSMALTALAVPEAGAARSQTCRPAVRRWWAAYTDWRIGHAAIAQLCAMSDRKLQDIGLTRTAIPGTAGAETAREARLQVLLLSAPESILS